MYFRRGFDCSAAGCYRGSRSERVETCRLRLRIRHEELQERHSRSLFWALKWMADDTCCRKLRHCHFVVGALPETPSYSSAQVHTEPKSVEGVLQGTIKKSWFVCVGVRVPEVFDQPSLAPHETVEFGFQTTISPFKRKRQGEPTEAEGQQGGK